MLPTTWISSALLALSTFSPAIRVPYGESLLDRVPTDATALLVTEDISRVSRHLRGSDWVKLTGEILPSVDDLLEEVIGDDSDRARLGDLAEAAGGPAALWIASDTSIGLIIERPENMLALRDAVRAILEEEGAVGGSADGVAVFTFASGKHCAMSTGLDGFALSFDEESMEGALAHLRKPPERAGIARLFERERERATRPTDLLLCIDRAGMVSDSGGITIAHEFIEGIVPDEEDPMEFLGLDADSCVSVGLTLGPGTTLELQVRMTYPESSLLAQLAGTMQTLPPDLPTRFPKGLDQVWAMSWDVMGFATILKEAVAETRAAGNAEAVEAGLKAASAASGEDLEEEVLNQLAGLFCIYRVKERTQNSLPGMAIGMSGWGLQVSLKDAERFQVGLESLLGIGGVEGMVDLQDFNGHDVWRPMMENVSEEDGGLAFLDHDFVLSLEWPVLRESILALDGEVDAQVSQDSEFASTYRATPVCGAFSWLRLSELRDSFGPGSPREETPSSETPEAAVERDPFESEGTFFMRNVPGGMEFNFRVL